MSFSAQLGGHRVSPGVLEHGHVGLLDQLAPVSRELGVDVERVVDRDDESGGDRRPVRRRSDSEHLSRGDGVLERAHRADVRVHLVVDVGVLLVGSGDAVDVVLAVAPERRARRPERRGAGQHRPALLGQPRLVPGDEVVLPLGERDVRGDVLLVQSLAIDRRRGRNLLGAVERALPREARARVARGRGVLLGLGEPLEPVRVHAGGEVGVLREQGRVHPRLRVPEDVAVVAIGRQARRGHAPVDARPRA